MRRSFTALLLAATGLLSASSAAVSSPGDQWLLLQVANSAALQGITAGHENAADGTITTRNISDILVQLRPARREGPLAARARPQAPLPTYVEARLFLVIGGRVDASGVAACETFEGDVLVCQMDCEGGAFGLRRGGRDGRHDMIVGMGAAQVGSTSGLGFKIGACRRDKRPPMLVMPGGPGSNGRLAITVPLVEVN